MNLKYFLCLLAFLSALLIVIEDNNVFAKKFDSNILLDLSNEKEDKEFYNVLEGDWVFYEQEIMSPNQIENKLSHDSGKVVFIPSSFKNQMGKVISFGTYSTVLKIPKRYVGELLAIHVPFQYSAYKLFVDKTEIAKNGVVGKNSNLHSSEMAPRTGYFIAQSEEMLITMQVSSFDHIRGGFENPIFLGEASIVTQKFNLKVLGALFINGSIFIIGLFMILFALYRKKEQLFLIFGTFAMLISIRSLFAVPFLYKLVFVDMSWLWGTRLEYMLTEASSMFFVILLWKWHEKEFSKKIMYSLVCIHLALIFTTLFTQPLFFQTLFFNVFYLSIPTFFYLIYVIYKGIRNDNQYANANLIGMIIVFLAFFNDFANGQNWYQSWTLMLPAVGLYIMIHVFLMSRNFAQSVVKTEELNKELIQLTESLDDEVKSQTKELRLANRRLEHLATYDHLTNIYNRRSFYKIIQRLFHDTSQEAMPLSLLMLDVDEFKKYNDHYGHIAGDRLLGQIVDIIKHQLPENSYFARYGGEEFVIIFPNMPFNVAIKTAEQIRWSVEQSSLEHSESETGIVTISIGVTTMENKEDFQSEIEMIDAADQKLYQSKQAGRNYVMY